MLYDERRRALNALFVRRAAREYYDKHMIVGRLKLDRTRSAADGILATIKSRDGLTLG
jgi:hypothetical protein